jgi:hypothetical protein
VWDVSIDRILRSAGLAVALATFLLGPLGGCAYHVHSERAPSVHGRGHGPPPHAPAHGHRHKRHPDQVELVFDAGLGVYLVIDRPGYYWHGDRYLHWSSGSWSVSHRIDGGWAAISIDAVPAGLTAKYSKQKHHGKAKHRKKHGWPAKRGY